MFRISSGLLISSLAALGILFIVAMPVAAQLQSIESFHVCVTVRVARTPHTQHAEFAARYYASRFPRLNVTTSIIGIYEEGSSSAIGVIRAWVVNASNCDVLIGPGSSSIAQAINPLVQNLWMDYSATSTELSDKSSFPLFSRVAPNDAQSTEGAADLMGYFGWKSISTLCQNNAYGRSVVAGVEAALLARGGQVSHSRCVNSDSTVLEMQTIIREMFNSASRVVFVGMVATSTAFKSFLTAALQEKAHERIIFIFSESACSSSSITWQQLPGSFCATFGVDQQFMNPFLTAYATRDHSATDIEFRKINFPPSEVNLYDTAVFPAYAHDATLFSMEVFNAFLTEHSRRPEPGGEEIAIYARTKIFRGASGLIALNDKGDRLTADMSIVNAEPNNGSSEVGRVSGGNITMQSSMFWFGESARRTNFRPSHLYPVPPAPTDLTPIIVPSVVGGLVLTALLAVVMYLVCKTKPDKWAPKDDSKPFAMVFTDVQASTFLWATHPLEMGGALDTHHSIVRDCIADHHGYEVKTIGDSFMVAFESTDNAVKFALDVQKRLYEGTWEGGMDESLRDKLLDDHDIYIPDKLYYSLWNGLRVRIGVHFGTGSIIFDQVTERYDYYGTVVNQAARIESVAHGGQVLLSQDAMNEIDQERTLADAIVLDLGPQPLRGLPEPVPLIQVTLKQFEKREFPPLRLDAEGVEVPEPGDDDDDDDDNPFARVGPHDEESTNAGGGTFDPELQNKKLARKAHLPEELLWASYRTLSSFLSPLDLTTQTKVVTTVADKWRVEHKPITRRYTGQDAILAVLLRLAVRTSLVVSAQQKLGLNSTMTLGASSRRRESKEGKEWQNKMKQRHLNSDPSQTNTVIVDAGSRNKDSPSPQAQNVGVEAPEGAWTPEMGSSMKMEEI